MNQTGVIFFGLLVGFVVFITVRGELAAYLDVIGLESGRIFGNSPGATTAGSTAVGIALPTIRF
jgi:hypothetical protein